MSTLFTNTLYLLVSSRSLVGSKPFIIRQFCTSTVAFFHMISAYVNFIAFGLTAKQPLFSTDTHQNSALSNYLLVIIPACASTHLLMHNSFLLPSPHSPLIIKRMAFEAKSLVSAQTVMPLYAPSGHLPGKSSIYTTTMLQLIHP